MPATTRSIFVYGTLMSDQPNHRLIANLPSRIHPATLDDWALYGATHAFPYAVPEDGEHVIGEVITFLGADIWTEALRRCDGLEGYPTHYDRVRVFPTIGRFGAEPVLALTYTPTDPTYAFRLGKVLDGDWRAHRAEVWS